MKWTTQHFEHASMVGYYFSTYKKQIKLKVSVEKLTTGHQGQLAGKFRSRLAAKLAASFYYVLFIILVLYIYLIVEKRNQDISSSISVSFILINQ